jgi:hypothetical protein
VVTSKHSPVQPRRRGTHDSSCSLVKLDLVDEELFQLCVKTMDVQGQSSIGGGEVTNLEAELLQQSDHSELKVSNIIVISKNNVYVIFFIFIFIFFVGEEKRKWARNEVHVLYSKLSYIIS